MKLLSTTPFFHQKSEFEINLYQSGVGFSVIVFKNGKRINPYTYNVTFDNASDYEFYNGQEGYKKLIEIAKEDIKSGLTFDDKLKD